MITLAPNRATTKHGRENEMYELAEYEVSPQRRREDRREVPVERPTRGAPEDLETMPYVVRDLSWEFARYLETQIFPESAEKGKR